MSPAHLTELDLPVGGVSVSRWQKYTITAAQLSAAAANNDIELLSLPAKGFIQGVMINATVAFTGGLIVTYTLRVGITGNLGKYCTASSVFTANVVPPQMNPGMESFSGATSIRVAATCAVGNLSQATQGSADIWVLWGRLE